MTNGALFTGSYLTCLIAEVPVSFAGTVAAVSEIWDAVPLAEFGARPAPDSFSRFPDRNPPLSLCCFLIYNIRSSNVLIFYNNCISDSS